MSIGAQSLASLERPGIVIDALAFAFPGMAPIFSNFSLRFDAGITALLGPSGLGKTTLLRLIAGRLTPSCGSIAFQGASRLAWMGQSGGLMPWATVEDNVALGARLRGERLNQAKVLGLLTRVGLEHAAAKRPAELSGGMRQRTALARVLMEEAGIVLLDEPFVHLDAPSKSRLYDIVARELSGRAVIAVTHDPMEALTLSDRVLVLTGQPIRIAADIVLPKGAPRDPRDPVLNDAYAKIFTALEKP